MKGYAKRKDRDVKRDTQCGFKLLSRASLPFVIPYMHCEGWILDVEMPMIEVETSWKEVLESKRHLESLGMAWGLTKNLRS
ncbi:hypothetical protein BU16DRAFT_525485 [Lophium mytilinum]|uniref:Uncharacterized protein n=1 Tax=Lophium mytilinum TaxID=390894 RepID=A0A6A6QZM4_9PEZI|nr:hypothetical protein BU16DRAFT_525485 [Lophium mytilinum]